jgi:hypothetical protein
MVSTHYSAPENISGIPDIDKQFMPLLPIRFSYSLDLKKFAMLNH